MDIVIENFGEVIDTVVLPERDIVVYDLPDNVENLIQQWSQESTLGGNELDNVLTARTLPSGFWNVLRGGAGNDSYIIGNGLDFVFEKAGEGTDTVQSRFHVVLSQHVEILD